MFCKFNVEIVVVKGFIERYIVGFTKGNNMVTQFLELNNILLFLTMLL